MEGETRFSKIGKISGMTPGADVKAEDLRQLFLAMTEEVRIIVVKLADRLHNMRTLGSMKPEKQKKIAAETLQVGFAGSLYQAFARDRQTACSKCCVQHLFAQACMLHWATCRPTCCRPPANIGSCSVVRDCESNTAEVSACRPSSMQGLLKSFMCYPNFPHCCSSSSCLSHCPFSKS